MSEMKASDVTVPTSIVDFHCHIASQDFFPPSFLDGIIDNLGQALESSGIQPSRKTLAAMYTSKWQDPLCDQLIAEMDAAGIEQSVLLLPDFTYAMSGCAMTIAEMIDHHKKVLERHKRRLLVFAGVDPRWGKDGLDLFEKTLREYGFHGLKLYPPCGYQASDPVLYPFYEVCREYRVPVLVHIGATSPALSFEEARPIYIDKAARDFPEVDFILAHGSVHYPDECAMLCSHRANVFLDVSGFESTESDALGAIFKRGINHKVLFGTDWPIFRLKGTQKQFVDRFRVDGAFPSSMSNREQESFFAGNARRILAKRRSATVAAEVLASTS